MTRSLFETYVPENSEDKVLRKVMLVEDDPVSRWLVRISIRDEGMLITCANASKFYEAYLRYRPDIVFMDINLPDGDGRTLMKWVGMQDPEIPVIALSGETDRETITAFMNEGGSGFITKPFRPEVLRTQIAACPFPLNRG